MTEKTKDEKAPEYGWWYFTFGHGQRHFNKYVKYYGTFFDARAEMIRIFGSRWSFQYPEVDNKGRHFVNDIAKEWGWEPLEITEWLVKEEQLRTQRERMPPVRKKIVEYIYACKDCPQLHSSGVPGHEFICDAIETGSSTIEDINTIPYNCPLEDGN